MLHSLAARLDMRKEQLRSVPLGLLLAALLSACASAPDAPINKHISQRGPLKVHPGLVGMPVPDELQPVSGPAAAIAEAPIKMDEVGLRTQRSVYFDLDSAALRTEFNPMLQAHGRYLKEHPKSRVRLEGNADERGSSEYNHRLGLRRAEAVRQAIISHGANDKQVAIKTLGEARPKLKGHDEESWAENRRADVVYEREE